mmetsp:Transcript_39100/g.111598  ORF Transcript_39100/g.111598 Transcript_39100/m.111598 type:complete len:269 (+) Transcript_39100:455-1261(+)
MVRSFGGQMTPGTPDGMFESWDGALTCVQVVRVPLVASLTVGETQERLAQTVLTKVVKSQQWLRFTQAKPADFVVFCWLPFAVPPEVVQHAEDLMLRIRLLDPRFSLRLRTPEEPSALFPALFARNRERRDGSRPSLSESAVSTYAGSEPGGDDDDEACEWDITWAWDLDLGLSEEPECEGGAAAEEEESEEGDVDWDGCALDAEEAEVGQQVEGAEAAELVLGGIEGRPLGMLGALSERGKHAAEFSIVASGKDATEKQFFAWDDGG